MSRIIIIIVLFIAACAPDNVQESNLTPEEKLDKLIAEVPTWRTDSSSVYFKIDVPIRMIWTPELNEGAEIAYSYTQEVAGEMKEFYLLVLVETHEQIDSYGFSQDFNLSAYNKAVLSNVTESLDHYELLGDGASINKINEMDCIINEIFGSLGAVNIFYKLAVFKGRSAYFQVLTWTLDFQRSEFEEDMDKIIESFSETIRS